MIRARRLLTVARRAGTPTLLGLVVLWLLLASIDGLGGLDLLAGGAAALIGALGVRGAHRGGRPRDAALEPGGEALGVGAVEGLLRALAIWMRVSRLVVWERDSEQGVLRPVHASSQPPRSVPAAGDPVAWALDQGQPLRLDRTPAWAEGPTTAAPVVAGRRRLVLTAERLEGTAPPAEVADAAALLAPILVLAEREARATGASARFDRFVEFLGALPRNSDPDAFPRELARLGAELAGAAGAAVAAWNEEAGQVLARWGTGGGPAAGTYFGVMDGDFAMAARACTTLWRTHSAARPPKLAHAGERWAPAPRHLAVVPLVDASGHARGLTSVWGPDPLDEEGIHLIEALGPLLALQLQHSSDLVRFRQRAHEDALTALPNRAAFEEKLREERLRFHRYRRSLALIALDLDHFKRINDTYGHAAGDAVLERVADVLRAAIRESDYPARIGGEELVVLLPETMRREAGEVAERVRAAIARAVVEWNGERIPITASLGVTACPETVEDPDELLRSADDALYASKNGGRNRVTVALPVVSGG